MAGRIILLNGTSSAGKSTLATALRPLLPATFCYFASDQLADAGFRQLDPVARWDGRDAFFAGFHHSIAAFASAGLDLLVEHVVEQRSWAEQLDLLLQPFDLFRVGVRASLDVLERRERARSDRNPGQAREHLGTYDHYASDLEIDNVGSPDKVAQRVLDGWHRRHEMR